MPFDLQAFKEKMGFDKAGVSLAHIMRNFQEVETEETDEFVVFRAVIATMEQNPNFLYFDEDTMQNIASMSNRETAGNDIPIFPNHQRYDFQIGNMLTAEYQKASKRVVGTFQITKDSETEVLIRRMKNGTIRDISPTVVGPVECNYCNAKVYRWGGCENSHYLGETIVGEDGEEILIEGTFKNAILKEVSVVSMGALTGATTFSENEELIKQAYSAGHIDERVIDTISQQFSVEIDLTHKATGDPDNNTNNTNNTGDPEPISDNIEKRILEIDMSNTTDADVQLLKDNNADLKRQVTEKDKEIANLQQQVDKIETDYVAKETHDAKVNELAQEKAKTIEKDGKLGKADAVISEYNACVEYTRNLAISFYAKVRGVETDDTSDPLFNSRKKALQESESLTYLLTSLEQYQDQYYANATQFGGSFKDSTNENSHQIPSDYTPLAGFQFCLFVIYSNRKEILEDGTCKGNLYRR